MNEPTLSKIVDEIAPILTGKSLGKVFQLSARSLALDLRPFSGGYLFIDVNIAAPRLYLIDRRLRDLDRASLPPTPFAVALRTRLGNAEIRSVVKDPGERIVRFRFTGRDELSRPIDATLVAQLTGRSANLLLFDGEGIIIATLRPPRGEGQQIGEKYVPPPAVQPSGEQTIPFSRDGFTSWSAAADDFYQRADGNRGFSEHAGRLRSRLKKEIAQRAKLVAHLQQDLAGHGDAEQHKRIGDLLLANLTTAQRDGERTTLNDYFSPDGATVEVEIDPNQSLQDAAAKSFDRYGKAKRAAVEVTQRLVQVRAELAELQARNAALEIAIATGSDDELSRFEPAPPPEPTPGAKKPAAKLTGVRRYLSSDGYEILVGRAARDNDHLTFKIARPHDLWLHAADYPGSHVVVRNRSRLDFPQRTIIEAAQLAANYSQAKRDNKVNIHYTQRKYISKPKGSAPGLVRLSQFKTLTVEPRESGTKL
jgi:predicted ribosome quality control (RQC) complex YloA/Tae2 family protein